MIICSIIISIITVSLFVTASKDADYYHNTYYEYRKFGATMRFIVRQIKKQNGISLFQIMAILFILPYYICGSIIKKIIDACNRPIHFGILDKEESNHN